MGRLAKAVQAKAETEKQSVQSLQAQVRQLEETIRQLRAAKMFSMPIGKGSKAKRGDSFLRVIVSDTHGSALDGLDWKDPGSRELPQIPKITGGAAKAFLDDLEFLRPAEVFHLGDVVEAGAFLAEHHAFCYVHEAKYTWVEDQLAANLFLNEAQKRSPDADWKLTEGNHDARPEIWCIDKTKGNFHDAQEMAEKLGTRAVLGMKERRIDYVGRSEYRDGLNRPGTIKRNGCHFLHGEYSGNDAAKKAVDDFCANVCFGHTHRVDTRGRESIHDTHVQAWNFGALCKRRRMWNHTRSTNWQTGYGIQVVRPADNLFLTLPISIIDGVSLLPCMVGHFKTPSKALVKR
jgi:predicted phosphodiesterase